MAPEIVWYLSIHTDTYYNDITYSITIPYHTIQNGYNYRVANDIGYDVIYLNHGYCIDYQNWL